MADFNIRSESVDVEQIMKQIRARIREKRGVDYTEDQIRELATVRLEKFLDPKNLRSDLLEQFRRSRPAIPSEPAPVEAPYSFSDQTLYETHRGLLRLVRRLLNPILKLFFNPNPLINVLHTQAQFNVDLLKREQRRKIEFDRSRAEWNALYYEVLHNLVLETTRSGIELKNLKMRVESLASRLDFSERRVRALEGVVQYRPEAIRRSERDRPSMREEAPGIEGPTAPLEGREGGVQPGGTIESARRRRRRRRGRRGAGVQPSGAPAEPSDHVPGSEPLSQDTEAPDAQAPDTEAMDDAPFLGEADEDNTDSTDDASSDDPSTLREPQGRPEQGRGTTSAGSSRAPSRDDDQQ